MWFRVVPVDMSWNGGRQEYRIQWRPNLKTKWALYAVTYQEAYADHICELLNRYHIMHPTGR